MTCKLADAARNAMTDARAGLMVSGTVKIYSGTQPATADTAPSGSLLATFTLDSSPFGSSGSPAGTATAADVPFSVNAGATGQAGYYRVEGSGGTDVEDGACGTSGTEMTLSTTSLVSGVAVTITAWTLNQPAS